MKRRAVYGNSAATSEPNSTEQCIAKITDLMDLDLEGNFLSPGLMKLLILEWMPLFCTGIILQNEEECAQREQT